MTTINLSNETVNVEAHPVLVDAGSSRTTLHKLAARFWLHPGYIGRPFGSGMQ
jgi:hypothetical protein